MSSSLSNSRSFRQLLGVVPDCSVIVPSEGDRPSADVLPHVLTYKAEGFFCCIHVRFGVQCADEKAHAAGEAVRLLPAETEGAGVTGRRAGHQVPESRFGHGGRRSGDSDLGQASGARVSTSLSEPGGLPFGAPETLWGKGRHARVALEQGCLNRLNEAQGHLWPRGQVTVVGHRQT